MPNIVSVETESCPPSARSPYPLASTIFPSCATPTDRPTRCFSTTVRRIMLSSCATLTGGGAGTLLTPGAAPDAAADDVGAAPLPGERLQAARAVTVIAMNEKTRSMESLEGKD